MAWRRLLTFSRFHLEIILKCSNQPQHYLFMGNSHLARQALLCKLHGCLFLCVYQVSIKTSAKSQCITSTRPSYTIYYSKPGNIRHGQ